MNLPLVQDPERRRRLLRSLPARPGVYLMLDATARVIYVGKSRRLAARVRSYFSGRETEPRRQLLISAIVEIEFIVTDTEAEALILENNLIKRHRPRYNVLLRDDKTHPYLVVTLSDAYPRLLKVRKVRVRDGNRYFGPFPDEKGLRYIQSMLVRSYRLCTCKSAVKPERPARRACLRYHLGHCQGPCIGAVTPDDYRRHIDEVVAFLRGRRAPDFPGLRRRMTELAQAFRYEEAGELRDTIAALEKHFSAQKVELPRTIDRDLWGVAESPDKLVVSVFFLRAAKLLGHRSFTLDRPPGETVESLLGSVMMQFYDGNVVPRTVLTARRPQPLAPLVEALTGRRGRPVRVATSRRGVLGRLLKMAEENALEILKNVKATGHEKRPTAGILELERRLGLPRLPWRIECIDISHLAGQDPVASIVVAVNGAPHRPAYRTYHVKTVVGPDDPASMREVLERRWRRLLADGGSEVPDLLVVDGGIAQANVARAVLDELGQQTVPVFGLAKREETLVPPAGGEPVQLPRSSPAMRVLIQLRDEAHRVAHGFQRRTHTRRAVRSSLLDLPGVGEKTVAKILAAFGSLPRAAAVADPVTLAEKAGIPRATAARVLPALVRLFPTLEKK